MTRIIVISDTHDHELPDRLINLLKGADMIIHAGDFTSRACYDYLGSIGEMVAVHGNSDCAELRKLLPERVVFTVEDITIGMVHEGQLSTGDTSGLWYLAKELGVDVMIVGHIHTPFIEQSDVLIACPGSPTVPRLADKTVIELVIEGSRVHGQIISLGAGACFL